MYVAPGPGVTMDQTASSPAVLRVILQDLSSYDGFEHFSKMDFFFHHFLMGVLRDSKVVDVDLRADLFQHLVKFGDV
jgi:hypothetical protein